ncbi:MAG TPA: hypothetical protein VLR26_01070 [Frankiaceae bacterium]|nr:hypothetical protein [Frankiaceae bacterium]
MPAAFRRVPAAGLTVLTALAALLVVLLAPAAEAGTPVARPDATHPVVVIGVDGLTWAEVGAATPGLDALAHSGTSGLLAARGADEKTSVLDAWASLSAGNRARARDLPPPTDTTDPGVAVAQRQTKPARTGARIGALADALGPDCVSGSGARGAVLAAATSTGRLAPAGAACPVHLVEVTDPLTADAAVQRWRSRAALLLVVGLGDAGTSAHLHVAVASGAGYATGRLASGSTRRAPYVQTVDVAPTVLAALGRPEPTGMIGEAWYQHDHRPFDRGSYLTADRRARFMPTVVLGVVLPLVAVFVLTLLFAAALCWRGRRDLGWTVALWNCRLVAATPAATFLARLVSYERVGLVGLWALILALDAVILVVCRARIAWIAVLTAVVLASDVIAGAPLQLHSVLGYSALVAGRFAGLGNPAFGAFAAAVLITAMLVGGALGSVSGSRSRRAASVAAVGLLAVLVDGAPMLGSDVGGVLALVPAVALLTWAVAGRRIRVRTVLLAALGAVAVLVLFAAVDLARAPESRTHLGRFASDLLNGRAGDTLSRKAAANWALLTRNVATLLVVPTMAVLAVVVARADRWSVTAPLGRALREQPGLRAGLGAALVAGTLGFAVNDSGVVVPAVMMLLVVPIAIEAAAGHRNRPGESLASTVGPDVP